MDRKHALLSPSGSHRWLHCTPSARFEERFEKGSSVYADEGTLAHDIAALHLFLFKGIMKKTEFQKKYAELRAHELYQPEMDTYVSRYVQYIKELYHTLKQKGWADLHIEIEIDYSYIVPEGFGHLDCAILSPGRLDIVDLKYGKGVPVSAIANPQLGLYAIGALQAFKFVDQFTDTYMHVYQPRIDNISVDRNSVTELTRWGEGSVKKRALIAFKGEGEFSPGSHCQFCAGRTRCKALADHHKSLAKYDFINPDELTNEEIAEIFLQSDQFINWINSIRDYATDQAKNGKEFKGLKLVTGRSNRKFLNEEAVIKAMTKAGFKPEQYRKFAALSVPEIEKLLGARFDKLLGKQVIKPQGAPALVPLTDKRDPIKGAAGAKADFKDLKI
jgi:hypothetical protein